MQQTLHAYQRLEGCEVDHAAAHGAVRQPAQTQKQLGNLIQTPMACIHSEKEPGDQKITR